ncbi:MAG: hypothetical protein IJU39_05400 [Clostridia bacterium]|nr:hypothetical protein [Clostridia bacterium]
MKLSLYDDKCVRITLRDGSVFEGSCKYNSDEFNLAELGIDEDSLEISGWLFKKGEIGSVEVVDESNPFQSPFGTIEEETVSDGPDAIYDVLSSEEPVNAERLLNCLEHRLANNSSIPLPAEDQLAEVLQNASSFALPENLKTRCKNLAASIINNGFNKN